jgi:cyclopropane fatty-acyl-phospholipid synthase-like methyltransferase
MSIQSAIVDQFKRPSGLVGSLAGWIMTQRPSNRERNRWAVALLDLEEGDRVLEIGCGPGLALGLVADRVSAGSVVGLDHSPLMVAWARRRNKAHIDAGRLEVRCGAIEDLRSVSEPFNKVFSVNVVQFFPSPVEDLRLIHGIMQPGGRIVSVHQPRHRGATGQEALSFADRLLEQKHRAGFVGLRVQRLPLHPVEAVAVLGEAGGTIAESHSQP